MLTALLRFSALVRSQDNGDWRLGGRSWQERTQKLGFGCMRSEHYQKWNFTQNPKGNGSLVPKSTSIFSQQYPYLVKR